MCATMALVSPLAGRFVDASKQYFLIMFTGMAVAGGVLSSAALDLLSDPLLLLIVSSIGYSYASIASFDLRIARRFDNICGLCRFSVYSAAVWPTVPLLVSPSAHGTAYGLLISFQNLGLSLGAEAVSAMQPPRCGNSYECSLFTLAGFAGVGVSDFAVDICCRPVNSMLHLWLLLPLQALLRWVLW